MPWQEIFRQDPYQDFLIGDFPPDYQGWGDHPIFEIVIRKLRPNLIIEVGTWKGYSALRMADWLEHYGIPGRIICVDTFLGSPEHFMGSPGTPPLLKFKNGFPTLYSQFLANVIHRGKQDVVRPLPQTSDGAYFLLKKLEIQAAAIYLDAAHDYEAVKRDLRNYWELVKPGGVLFGDDYDSQAWPGVVQAVNEFVRERELPLITDSGKYLIDTRG